MATGVFGLRKVYIKQYQNVDNKNFASWPEGATYGYYGGGYASGFDPSVIYHEYSTSTLYTVSSSLGNNRDMGTTSNYNYGYFVGGTTSSSSFTTTAVNRFEFSSRTLSLPGKNLPASVQTTTMGSTENNSYGYFAGGTTYVFPGSFPTFSTVLRFEFSTENISLPGNNLPGGITQLKTSCKNNNYGYFTGSFRSTILRLDFSNETITAPGKDLPSSRSKVVGSESILYGYFGGGYIPTPSTISTITRLDFSNEVISDPGKNLPQSFIFDADGNSSINSGFLCSRTLLCRLDYSTEISTPLGLALPRLAGTQRIDIGTFNGQPKKTRVIGSNTYGYFAGGFSPPWIANVQRVEFSTEILSTPTSLPTSRGSMAAVSSSSYGYFGGGGNPTSINTISRLDFSNEIFNDPGKNLPTARYDLSATSSSSYGYFAGGFTPPYLNTISRLDFSSETVSDPGKNLPSGRSNLAATSSSSYGYFGGGVGINTISRLDFSSETTSDPGKNLPYAINYLAATASTSYGYFGGGYVPLSTYRNTISRLDFSTENVSLPGKDLLTVSGLLAAVSN